MTACSDQTVRLHGLLDGELDAANALACEAHLMGCAECDAEFSRLLALREAIRAPGVAHGAPAAMRARIEASIPAMEAGASVRRRLSAPLAWSVGGAAAAIAATVALAVVPTQVASARIDDELVASHVRSLLASHLTDVVTSSEHVVRPWFNGRIDFAPPVPELSQEGFLLVGGRLDYVDGRVVPAIVYRRRLHTVNLFVWPDAKGRPRPLRSARRDGYSLVEWSQGGLRLSAVSDIEAGDLEAFQRAFAARAPR